MATCNVFKNKSSQEKIEIKNLIETYIWINEGEEDLIKSIFDKYFEGEDFTDLETINNISELIRSLDLGKEKGVEIFRQELQNYLLDLYTPKKVSEKQDTVDLNSNDNLDYNILLKSKLRLNSLFKNRTDFKNALIEEIKQELSDILIVDYDSKEILITNQRNLNRSIRDFKLRLLDDLYTFLKDSGISVEDKPKSVLNSVGNISEEGMSWYNDVIKQATLYFNESKIQDLYIDFYTKDDRKSLQRIRALKGFLLLSSDGNHMAFDDFIKENFPKLLNIKDTPTIFAGIKDDRYSLSINRLSAKAFGTDRMEDGEDQMGVLGKMLILSTPRIDLSGRHVGYLNYDDIIDTFMKIKSVETLGATRLSPELWEPINNLYHTPTTSMEKILKIALRKEKNYRNILKLTDEELIVLNSIYLRFFEGQRSLKAIEHRTRRFVNKVNTGFSLLSTAVASILRNEDTQYMLIVFDGKMKLLVVRDLLTNNTYRTKIRFNSSASLYLKVESDLKYKILKHSLKFYKEKNEYSDGTQIPIENNFRLLDATGAVQIKINLNGRDIDLLVNPKRISSNNITSDIVAEKRILIISNDVDGSQIFTDLPIYKTGYYKKSKDGKTIFVSEPTKGLSVRFPSIILIKEYFTTKKYNGEGTISDLDLRDKENEGYLLTLKLLEVVCDLMPVADLANEELPVLLQWLQNYGYDGTIENSTRVVLQGFSDLINICARGILLNDRINDINNIKLQNGVTSFKTTDYLNSVIGFVNGPIYDYYDEGTDTIKLIWGFGSNAINIFTEAYNDVLGRHFRYVTDREGNKLPISRLFTMINHLQQYASLKMLQCVELEYDSDLDEMADVNKSVVQHNLFFKYPSNQYLLTPPKIYVDATNLANLTKKISNMSALELNYDALINRFLVPLINNDLNKIYIHPVTYADKITIPMFDIPKNRLLFEINGRIKNIDFATISIQELKYIISETVGKQYEQVKNNIISSYKNIFKALDIKYLNDLILRALNKTIDESIPKDIKDIIQSFKDALNNNKNNDINNWTYEAFAGLMLGANKDDINRLHDISASIGEEFIEEIHYSKSLLPGFDFNINYLIYHYSLNLFSKKNEIESYYLTELANYVKDILPKFTKYIVDEDNNLKAIVDSFDINGVKIESSKNLTDTVQKLREEWVDKKTGLFVLAKDANGQPIYDVEKVSRHSTINPLILRYFYSNYLLIQNIKGISSGSETAHPAKIINKHFTSWNDLMIQEEAARTNASFKRTVDLGVPGVLLLQNDIHGVPPRIRIAVMEDILAKVYNILGETKNNLEANDGSALTNPLLTILIHLSLQDCSGKHVMKSIVRDQHGKYGGNILIKYASFAMLNSVIRDSLANSQFDSALLLLIFKLMTDLKFDEEYGDGLDKIPEIVWENGERHKVTDVPIYDKEGNLVGVKLWEIDLTKNLFLDDIKVTDMSNNEPIYYYKNGKHYLLLSIEKNKEKHSYKIKTILVAEIDGVVKQIKDTEQENDVIIDSLWELYQVLGGQYSENFINGQFIFGDLSLYTTVSYINNVGRTYATTKEHGEYIGLDSKLEYQTLLNTWQPLKYKFIGSLVNKSAIKVGAANINKRDTWSKPGNKLNTMRLNTSGYLMVLDYDHLVTDGESTLTEFTLVISALIERGTSYPQVLQVYETLANISASETKEMLDRLNDFINKTGKKEELYRIIGRMLIDDLDTKKGTIGLYEAHVQELEDLFNSTKALFSEEDIILPFSNASSFTRVVTVIISTINRIAVKRKFPGSGLIMVPSYGFTKLFNVPGSEIRSFSDLLMWIDKGVENNNINGINTYTINLGYTYNLENKRISRDINVDYNAVSGEIINITDTGVALLKKDEQYYPDLNVLTKLYKILRNITLLNLNVKVSEKLDDRIKNIINIALKYTTSIDNEDVVNNFRNFIKEVTLKSYISGDIKPKDPMDLQLGQIILPIKNINGNKQIVDEKDNPYSSLDNIEQITPIYIDSIEKLEKYSSTEQYSGFIIDTSVPRDLLPTNISFKTTESRRNSEGKLEFYTVKRNLWTLPVIKNNIKIIQDKNSTEEKKKLARLNILLELILIHSGKFTNEAGQKVSYQEGTLKITDYEARLPRMFAAQFKLRAGDSIADIIEQDYKFFLKRFKEYNKPALKSGWDLCLTNSDLKHTYITFKKPSNDKIILPNYVYSKYEGDYMWITDVNGKKIYPRKRLKRNEKGEIEKERYTDKDGQEKEREVWEDCIVQIVAPNGSNETLYWAIDSKEASKLYSTDNESIIINNNSKISKSDLLLFFTTLEKDTNIKIPKRHKEILLSLSDENTNVKDIISNINEAFEIDENKARSIANSFKESLKTIVARIPSQTQQSFMKMRVIGFLDTDSNLIQVSHFQTWILGSDYDIDKAYAMMLSFKDSGLLYTWSPYFVTSNAEQFKKSLEIPVPTGERVKLVRKGDALDISKEVEDLLLEYNGDLRELFYKKGHSKLVELLKKVGFATKVTINLEVFNRFSKFGENNDNLINEVISAINRHNLWFSNLKEKYDRRKPSKEQISLIFRNIVAYKIMDVITDVRNLENAQSPVTVEDLSKAAEQSPLGERNKRLISACPSMVNITTEDNLSGKMGIGVGANGAKDNFALIYHFMDSISSKDIARISRLPFNFNVTLLKKEENDSGDVVYREHLETITFLPNIDTNTINSIDSELNNLTKLILSNYLKSIGYTDELIEEEKLKYDQHKENTALVISSIISAATDNAKELILRKINGDPRYMKIYLFSAITGIDLKYITELMTSDDINFILNESREDMFDQGNQNYLKKVIGNMINMPKLPSISNEIETLILNKVNNSIFVPKDSPLSWGQFLMYINRIYKGKFEENDPLAIKNIELVNINILFSLFADDVLKLNPKLGQELNRYAIYFAEYKKHFDPELTPIRVEAFNKLLKGGNEISCLARFLKINLGMDPVPSSYIERIMMLETDIVKRFVSIELTKPKLLKYLRYLGKEKDLDRIWNIIEELELRKDFDLLKFFNDNDYLEAAIIMDNMAKTCFSVLDIVANSPHFRLAYVDVFTGVRIYNAVSTRLNTLRKIRKHMFIENDNDPKLENVLLKNKQYRRINDVIDSLMIYEYIVQLDITIPIKKGDKIIKFKGENFLFNISEESKDLHLLSFEDISEFKYWFENTLMNAILHPDTIENISYSDRLLLRRSILIHDLINTTTQNPSSGSNMIVSRFNFVNFFNTFKPGYDLDKYNAYIRDIRNIGEILIFGRPLIDWLFIYDLITSKGKLEKDNLNPILVPFVKNEDTLIPNYFRLMDAIDKQHREILSMFVIEAFLKAAAPIVNRYNYNNYEFSKYKYVYIFNPNTGVLDLYRKLDREETKQQQEDMIDQYDYIRYPGLSFIKSLGSYMENNYSILLGIYDLETSIAKYRITKNTDIDSLKEKMATLVRQQSITIEINCK